MTPYLLLAAMPSAGLTNCNIDQVKHEDLSNKTLPIDISQWRDSAFSYSENYSFNDADYRVNVLVSFVNNLVEHSVDIDSEFVDIVDEYFWDMV